ncbi:MAG TPA: hypothetical protein VN765_08625 [Candidatus Acidoferrum sp.]|nr:hypothetical protein [Candidatus Acidoferrum sp.]
MSRRKNQKRALENGAGLDGVSLQLLAEDFAPLDELARQLASRVMRYVVDGAEAKVLAELAALRMAGPKMRLYGLALPARRSRSESRSASVPPAEELGARRRFFQSVQSAAPAFFVRLGRVYEAASRPLRVRMARAFGDPDLDWLQVLLMEATELTIHTWPRRCRPCAVLTSDLIEAMLEGEGHPRDLLVRAAFLPPKGARTRFGAELEAVWECLPGLGASAARHPAAVLGALSQANSKEQLRALDLMNKSQTPAAGFAGELFELVFSPSKRVRELATALLVQAPSKAGPFLREKAGRGESAQRARAVRLLWEAEGEKARAFLAAQLMDEQSKPKKSNKVWRALEEVLSPGPPESGPDEALPPELPGWWKKALGPKAGRAARLGEANAVAPLLAALKKEKDEATRSAMMTSLARLGVPPGQFLDRAGLLAESARVPPRRIREVLNWFPFHRLPPVHWADNGRLVEPEIVRGWLAQSCQRESPEPGPLLRQYAANLEAAGREALGQFVLEAWISEASKPDEGEEKVAAGRGLAALPLPLHPAGGEEKGSQQFSRSCASSAIASKGVLALAGACAAAGAVPLVRRYLDEWYGRKAAQGRALLQMVAWVEHPDAAQLLLAVAGGFRTRSIQEEAARQAERLAGRKHCTLDELGKMRRS